MTDLEKVLTGLKCLSTNVVDCTDCPYVLVGFCPKAVADDATNLLLEYDERERMREGGWPYEQGD